MKFLFVMLLFISGILLPLTAIVHTVDINGTGQYTSIQTAINASVPGDTVLVYPGRYQGYIYIQTANISLIGLEYFNHNPAYIDSTIIEGPSSNSCLQIGENIQNIYLRGISFTNGYLSGITLAPNSVSSIVNCDVYENRAVGISIYRATVFLSGVQIHDNHSRSGSGGINFTGGTSFNATFDQENRCSIYNNTGPAGQDLNAIGLTNDQNIYLDTFTVANPTSYYASKISTGFDFNLNFNILRADHQEINHDLYVSPTGNDANDGFTPQTALKTINTAIYRIAADSLEQKTVYVLPGSYSNAANLQTFPISVKSWVRLIGSGIGSTFINRDTSPLQPNNSVSVIAATNEIHYQISGMTLASINSIYSSGINAYHGDYVILSDLYLGNFHPGFSNITGRFLHSIWDNITVENITTNNYDGLVATTVQGTIRNCTFRNAVSTYASTEVSTYPVIGISTMGHLRIENCIFENLTMNDDDSRAITIGGSDDSPQNSFDIVNCIFRDIHSQREMIYIVSHNNPIINITNCTFAGNTGSIYTLMMNGTIHITNSIFYNNTPHEISLWPQPGETTQINVDYSCVQGAENGIAHGTGQIINYSQSNISANPLFTGGDEHGRYNYYLSESSPCRDAGTPDTTGLVLPGYDLLGHPRIFNNVIDMGCYEWNGVAADDYYIPSATDNALSIYPNPFNRVTNIEYVLVKKSQVSLQIYNIKGQLVSDIYAGSSTKGCHSVAWNGNDNNGKLCRNGIYFCKLKIGYNTEIKKIVLLK